MSEGADLPYAGTQGWSGSGASKDRAETEAVDGTATARQKRAIYLLRVNGAHGVTWREFATVTGMHHGQATSVLSVLHKTGRIARLTERRDRCSVYVLPEYIQGRETAAHGRKRPGLTFEEEVSLHRVQHWLDGGAATGLRNDIHAVAAALARLTER